MHVLYCIIYVQFVHNILYIVLLTGKTNIVSVLEDCISSVDAHLHNRIMPLLEERADIKVKIAGVSFFFIFFIFCRYNNISLIQINRSCVKHIQKIVIFVSNGYYIDRDVTELLYIRIITH